VLIKCKIGGEMIEVPEGQDPHAALDATGCPHCVDGHDPDTHCGQAANVCADNPDNHPGPCWQGPGSGERPDGCTVCRPLIFMGGTTLTLTQAAG
jgi:hypothetical protein